MPYYVYILTNQHCKVLYTGVTSSLAKRMDQHRAKPAGSFTARYKVDRLIYAEPFDELLPARAYEARLKRWRRAWKERLIAERNPQWRDLAAKVVE
jgi:putative endonuclease